MLVSCNLGHSKAPFSAGLAGKEDPAGFKVLFHLSAGINRIQGVSITDFHFWHFPVNIWGTWYPASAFLTLLLSPSMLLPGVAWCFLRGLIGCSGCIDRSAGLAWILGHLGASWRVCGCVCASGFPGRLLCYVLLVFSGLFRGCIIGAYSLARANIIAISYQIMSRFRGSFSFLSAYTFLCALVRSGIVFYRFRWYAEWLPVR